MSIWSLGLHHATAPLDFRGRFALPADRLEPMLRDLQEVLPGRPEVALLSTCNRTEIYCTGSHEDVAPAFGWLATCGGVPAPALRERAFMLQDGQAARHAFRVACGLDSMVLGEPQVLGQLKTAVRIAERAGTLGPELNQLFQRSFAVAKEVRSATDIGSHSISVAGAAVRLATQLFGSLQDRRVLFVGAGEMVELAATHFAAKKPLAMAVANRTRERAETLAARFGAKVVRLSEVAARLHRFDVVVSCTGAQEPLVSAAAVQQAMARRRQAPMLLVDLAVPRDIESAAGSVPHVHLHDLDDLSRIVSAGRAGRSAAVAQAEGLIAVAVDSFEQWLSQRHSVPLIRQLHARAEEWRTLELVRARRLLARSEGIEAVLQAFSRGLMNKVLHGAIAELKTADVEAHARARSAVHQFFLRDERQERRERPRC
ncbi:MULTISPECIES: glutamyl-tRNA reductase [Ramlibacter]|uniref:Glutamyl-tRNA reductase n=1 Tax=Ramlibacter pinisoli TaxID=2682844 RepID=A0A6N8IQE8_9BURK|nr:MULTISPECIES: glutamyl-tRNA reductase [Ramlibacter]MBA2963544.1 glutamyl-tRNA reductase [Ramlibacter sp. CGMCC 1.13660]MVQ28510.1 glutamyl-tRNA reductase [Ramlibacter pinisoli]